MNILKKESWKINENRVTDEKIYHDRRRLMKIAAITGAGVILPSSLEAAKSYPGKTLSFSKNTQYQKLSATPYEKITSYNNFYEFSLSKDGPAKLAHTLKPEPWTIEITGEVERPMTIDMMDIISKYPLEERIYRFRCVEGWSMVVPWIGFSLADLLKRFEPGSRAKYVA